MSILDEAVARARELTIQAIDRQAIDRQALEQDIAKALTDAIGHDVTNVTIEGDVVHCVVRIVIPRVEYTVTIKVK
jgi:hypothetical protein